MKIQAYLYNNVNNFPKKQQNVRFGALYNDPDLIRNEILQLTKIGYPNKYLIKFIKSDLHGIEQAQTLIELKQAGYNKRHILSSYNHNISNEELERLFFEEPHKVLNTVKLLGKKSFIASFSNKFENVENYIQTFGDIKPEHPQYQKLLELTNPTESLLYKNIQEQITNLKKQFQTTGNKDALIKKINDLTNKNKNLIKNSLTDYPEKIELAEFFYLMKDSNEILDSTLASYSKQNKSFIQDLLNNIVRKDSNDILCKQLDFKNNKYLSKLVSANQDFKTTYKKMLSILNQNPTKSIKNTILELPQNITTKKQFEELGVNFNKWITSDSKMQTIIKGNPKQQNVIKSLEQILDSPIFGFLSNYKEQKLRKEMSINGYQLKKQDSFPTNTLIGSNEKQNSLKLFKENQPVSFKDLPPLINVLTDFIKKDALWNSPDKSIKANIAKKTIEFYIKGIKEKMILASNEPKTGDIKITVQHVDMNNITHSLFLGNDASCCMAVGSGFRQSVAPNYIMNKMITAIEILSNNRPIGNTMCYIAEIDKKPALVLDNIEIKPDFRFCDINNSIKETLLAYAKQFGNELGIESSSIYIGANRNKINLNDYPILRKDIKIIGSSGEDKIYIDSISKETTVDEKNSYQTLLYKIQDSSETKPVKISNITTN